MVLLITGPWWTSWQNLHKKVIPMSAKNFNFKLGEYNIVKPKVSSALPWQIVTIILTLAVASQYAYFNVYKKTSASIHSATPDLSNDTKVALVTGKAVEFLRNTLTFSATQLDEHRKLMAKMMTEDYANAYQIVWQDPTLTAALKSRAVKVSISTNAPTVKNYDKDGDNDRYYVFVSGNIIVESDATYIKSVQHYFSGTVVLIQMPDGLKVQNVIWKNAE
jgi:hypothetical protein